jgi:hypothetical protein
VRGPRRRYSGRFLVVYGALGLVLGGAITGLVLLVTGPKHHTPPAWSSWKPAGSDVSSVTQQIAQHVGGEYRFAKDDKALVAVHSSPLVISTASSNGYIPVAGVELHGQSSVKGGTVTYATNATWEYTLCGDGTACSIARGTPSAERAAILRREAAELALYTFKYIPDVDAVVTLMPPKPPITSSTESSLVYLRRTDLRGQLAEPLRASVPPTPPVAAKPVMPNAPIDQLVHGKLFTWQPEQLQNGAAALVLDPAS